MYKLCFFVLGSYPCTRLISSYSAHSATIQNEWYKGRGNQGEKTNPFLYHKTQKTPELEHDMLSIEVFEFLPGIGLKTNHGWIYPTYEHNMIQLQTPYCKEYQWIPSSNPLTCSEISSEHLLIILFSFFWWTILIKYCGWLFNRKRVHLLETWSLVRVNLRGRIIMFAWYFIIALLCHWIFYTWYFKLCCVFEAT